MIDIDLGYVILELSFFRDHPSTGYTGLNCLISDHHVSDCNEFIDKLYTEEFHKELMDQFEDEEQIGAAKTAANLLKFEYHQDMDEIMMNNYFYE